MRPLDSQQFLRSLACGSGHARLHVDRFGIHGLEDELFGATAFCHYADPQSWPSNESWLLDLWEAAGVLKEWLPRLTALGPVSEEELGPGIDATWTHAQRFGLGYQLVKRGVSEGRQLMERLLCCDDEMPDLGAEEIIELEGADGLRNVLERLGSRDAACTGHELSYYGEILDRRHGPGSARGLWEDYVSQGGLPFVDVIQEWLSSGGPEGSEPPVRGRVLDRAERLAGLEESLEQVLEWESQLGPEPDAGAVAGPEDFDSPESRLRRGIVRLANGELRSLSSPGGEDAAAGNAFFQRLEAALFEEAASNAGRRVLLIGFRRRFRAPVAEAAVRWARSGDETLQGVAAQVLGFRPNGETVSGERALGVDLLEDEAGGEVAFDLALTCLRAEPEAGDVPLIERAARRLGSMIPPASEDESLVPQAMLSWAEAASSAGVAAPTVFGLAYPSLLSPFQRSSALRGLMKTGAATEEDLQLGLRDVDPGTRALAAWGLGQRLGAPGQMSPS